MPFRVVNGEIDSDEEISASLKRGLFSSHDVSKIKHKNGADEDIRTMCEVYQAKSDSLEKCETEMNLMRLELSSMKERLEVIKQTAEQALKANPNDNTAKRIRHLSK